MPNDIQIKMTSFQDFELKIDGQVSPLKFTWLNVIFDPSKRVPQLLAKTVAFPTKIELHGDVILRSDCPHCHREFVVMADNPKET